MSSYIDQIFCGGHQSKPAIKLRAGNLSMIYEHGNIRYISAGRNEIIRMIYSAVRDKNWLTIDPVITDERIERSTNSFRIVYNCYYRSGDLNFSAHYSITGFPDSTIVLSLEGEALSTFEKNRIGFCVLHPVKGCSGNPCLVTHSDGSSKAYKFPSDISPDQIFLDINAMRWETGGSECSIEFSGDIFETEDQRNWSDASFKTYSTPLYKPFPVTIDKGKKISQHIVFKAVSKSVFPEAGEDTVTVILSQDALIPLPMIGIGRSTRQIPMTENEISTLKELKFDHYRTDLYLFNSDWKNYAEQAVREAEGLAYPLEIVLFFDDNFRSQAEEFINWISYRKPEISVITLLHKTETVLPAELADEISRTIGKRVAGVPTCWGTNANFAQLNRNRIIPESCDMICYSVHPQEHASDNTTLTENLQAQLDTVESAKEFSGGKGIRVSPVNLQRRFNANIENYEQEHSEPALPAQVDSRLLSLFGACWTAASLKYLSESGAAGLTYYETVGERGIIQGDYPSLWPDHFRSFAGMIFPVAFVFQFILEEKSFSVVKSYSSSPLKADCLVLSDGINTRIIAVNFTSQKLFLKFEGFNSNAGMRQMHAGNYPEATHDLKWMENSPAKLIRLDEIIGLEAFSISYINTQWKNNNI